MWEAPPRLQRSAVAQQTWWERTCPRMQYFSHRICVGCTGLFADKSAPTKNRVSSVSYRLFDKRRLAGDLPETGSSTDTRGVSDTTWGRCAAHRCRRNLRELPRPPGRSRLTCTSINYRMFDKRRRFISGFYWVPHGSNKLTSTPPSTFPMCISPACNCTTSSTKFSPSPVLFRPLSGRGRE